MTLADLQQYKVVKAPPVSVPLGELTLHTLTAPSGGPVLALVTQIIHGMPVPVCLCLSRSPYISLLFLLNFSNFVYFCSSF